MRLPESLKAGLRAFTTSRYTPPKEVIKNIFSPPTLPSSFPHLCTTHRLAPTQVRDLNPASGRQDHTSSKTLISSSKVLFYYLSVILCITGVISLGKCAWIPVIGILSSVRNNLEDPMDLTDFLNLVFKILINQTFSCQHEARMQLLLLGFSFLFVGFFFLHIANWLYNRFCHHLSLSSSLAYSSSTFLKLLLGYHHDLLLSFLPLPIEHLILSGSLMH